MSLPFPPRNVSLKDWEASMKELIRGIDYIGDKLRDLEKRIETLESKPSVINNYNTYPQAPTPIWAPIPSYPTWTCKT